MEGWRAELYGIDPTDAYLAHWGIKGQKWGRRRWQNPDGSLTPEGYIHYYGHARRHRYVPEGMESTPLKEPADMTDDELRNIVDMTRRWSHNTRNKREKEALDKTRKKFVDEWNARERKKDIEVSKEHPYAKSVLEDIAKKTGKTLDNIHEVDRYTGKPTKEEADKDGGDLYKLFEGENNLYDNLAKRVSEQEFVNFLQKYYDRSVDVGDCTRTWYDPNNAYWRDFFADDGDSNTIFAWFGDHSISIDRDPDTGEIKFWGLEG